MKLRTKLLDIQAGGRNIAILGDDVASSLGVHSSDRVKIAHGTKNAIAIVNVAKGFPTSCVGLYEETSKRLGIERPTEVEVKTAEAPESLRFVQAKLNGERLRKKEIGSIVKDAVERHLSDVELAAFVTSLHTHGLTMDEAEAMSNAMVKSGKTLDLKSKQVLDKHSIGGIPGDKTTILVVPIIAAAGFTIPKTSSRAVTSAAGTADRVEILCPVDLSIEEIKKVVKSTKGCMVWGGALELAPADDIFIQVEYPLAIDPMLLPSIMSKKKSIGATHVVVDIPTGRNAKMKTLGESQVLADDFIDLGRRLGVTVQCAITFGEQPIGKAIGPALEAREALQTILGNGPSDLREKARSLSGMLLEMVGVGNGEEKAEHLMKSGRAERKLREIIAAQGGDPEIAPDDIEIGQKRGEIEAEQEGRVVWINNEDVARIAKEAGAPKEKGAGVLLRSKLGDPVRKGETLLEIFAERYPKLEAAEKLAKKLKPVGLSGRPGERIVIERIPRRIVRAKASSIER